MAKTSFKIYTLGCKVNQYDSGALAAKLRVAGFVMEKNMEYNFEIEFISKKNIVRAR